MLYIWTYVKSKLKELYELEWNVTLYPIKMYILCQLKFFKCLEVTSVLNLCRLFLSFFSSQLYNMSIAIVLPSIQRWFKVNRKMAVCRIDASIMAFYIRDLRTINLGTCKGSEPILCKYRRTTVCWYFYFLLVASHVKL